MIPYDYPLSSYAQKVKIALREKVVAFERMLPDDFGTGRRDTAFAAATARRRAARCPGFCPTERRRSSSPP